MSQIVLDLAKQKHNSTCVLVTDASVRHKLNNVAQSLSLSSCNMEFSERIGSQSSEAQVFRVTLQTQIDENKMSLCAAAKIMPIWNEKKDA